MDRYQSTFKSKDTLLPKIKSSPLQPQKKIRQQLSNSKVNDDEPLVLLLNEILKRQIELEKKIDLLPISKLSEKSKKIVVQRDAEGKIIGAEIVE